MKKIQIQFNQEDYQQQQQIIQKLMFLKQYLWQYTKYQKSLNTERYDNYNQFIETFALQQKKMITTQLRNFKQNLYQYDNKSQASTEGQENYDFHSAESFAFPQSYCNDSKNLKSKLKSSLCKNFSEKGSCPYGQKCQFAHGTHQLRINLDVNNSYKTKPCNAFLKKGCCQYGYRCNFVHSEASQVNQELKWKKIYGKNREFFQEISEKSQSKLLRILN